MTFLYALACLDIRDCHLIVDRNVCRALSARPNRPVSISGVVILVLALAVLTLSVEWSITTQFAHVLSVILETLSSNVKSYPVSNRAR